MSVKEISVNRNKFTRVSELLYLLGLPAMLITIDILLSGQEMRWTDADWLLKFIFITMHLTVAWIVGYLLNRMFTFKFIVEPLVGCAVAYHLKENEGYICFLCFCLTVKLKPLR
tara:strand:+ start:420 stop:761 length:342 start_codon:yes stop_codon:yes gene_type:complete